jgi:nucleotide-binding universal stress UspA family protein
MAPNLFATVVVPIADPDDARETARAIRPYLDRDTELLVTHVVPKGGGVPDKASVEQREEFAEQAYQAFYDELSDEIASITPLTLYGRNVGETIVEGAREADATAIAYTPRGLSGWMKLLTGNVSEELLENGRLPVVVLPSEQ